MIKDNKKEFRTPTVTWFQTFDKVYLYIEECNLIAKTAKIEIFFKKMTFKIEKLDNFETNKNQINFNNTNKGGSNTSNTNSLYKKESNKINNKSVGELIKFDIDFFSDIYKDVIIDDSGRYLKLVITKKESQYWPRVTREKESFNWIKINNMNYREEEDDDFNIDSNPYNNEMFSEDYELSKGEYELINNKLNTSNDKIKSEILKYNNIIFDKLKN